MKFDLWGDINPNKLRNKPRHEEQDLQIACVNWFRLQHPQYFRLLHHNTNEGRKTKAQAGIDKRMGLQPGMPDLTLFVARKNYHALHIELKTKTGRQSENQKEMERLMTEQGYLYLVVRSIEEFMKVCNDYLKG